MAHDKETIATWNKIAGLYEEKFMDLDLYNDTYDAFCAAVGDRKANILEIGCGPGNVTRYLIRQEPGWSIIATDIAPNMIALAQKNNPSANCLLMDSRKIGELDMQFEGIIGGFVLPYLSVEESRNLIADCKKLLNNKGIVYLSFMDGKPEDSGYQTSSSGDRIYFQYHSLQTIIQTLIDLHFEEPQVYTTAYCKNDCSQEMHTIVLTQLK